MLKSEKINFIWVLKTLPISLSVLILFLCIFSSFEPVLNGYIIGQIVSINLHNFPEVATFLIKAFFAYAITYVSIYGFLNAKSLATKIINIRLKSIFLDKGFNSKVDNSDVINDVTTLSKQLEQTYFSPLFMTLQVGITIISSLIFILHTNIVLGIIYLLFSTFSLIPNYISKKPLNAKTNQWKDDNREMINSANIFINGKRDILNFKVKKIFFKLFKNKLNSEESSYREMSLYQFKIQLFSWGIALISFLGPIAIGIYLSRLSVLGITNGVIVSLVLTSDSVIGNIREATSYQNVINSSADIRNIEYKEINDEDFSNVATDNSGISVENLSVDIDGNNIFQNINLHVPDSSKVIITGPSGVGKSTFLNSLANISPTTSGTISYNGHKINTTDFAFISQDIWIFNDTLRNNISLYEDFSDEEILKVLTMVGLNDEFGKDPLNYKLENNGSNISGGQGQRIAIARGLIRNRSLFLLDEITSKLDENTAHEIRNIIYDMPVTIVEVAHVIDKDFVQKYNLQIYKLSKESLELTK